MPISVEQFGPTIVQRLEDTDFFTVQLGKLGILIRGFRVGINVCSKVNPKISEANPGQVQK